MITYGGAVLYDPGTAAVLEIAALPAHTVAAVLEITARTPHVEPLLHVMLDGRDRVCWRAGHATAFVESFVTARRNNPRLLPLEDWPDIRGASVFSMTLIGRRTAIDELRHELAPHLGGCFDTVGPDGYHPDETWFEIVAEEGTKAAAATRLQTAIGTARVVAFGDNLNDAPLFGVADHSCAVANAIPAVRDAADEVIGANDEDGVAAWLEHHVPA